MRTRRKVKKSLHKSPSRQLRSRAADLRCRLINTALVAPAGGSGGWRGAARARECIAKVANAKGVRDPSRPSNWVDNRPIVKSAALTLALTNFVAPPQERRCPAD